MAWGQKRSRGKGKGWGGSGWGAGERDGSHVSISQVINGIVEVVSGGVLRAGKTSYEDTSAGWWIGRAADGTGKVNIGNASYWVKWSGTALEVAGSVGGSITEIVLAAGGVIRAGKTSFADTTAGFWLGIDGGYPKFHLGGPTAFLWWDPTDSPPLQYKWSGAYLDAETVPGTALEIKAVTTDRLASEAVTATELASGAVTSAKLASGAVTTAKLGAGAVTGVKVDLSDGLTTVAKASDTGTTAGRLMWVNDQDDEIGFLDSYYWVSTSGASMVLQARGDNITNGGATVTLVARPTAGELASLELQAGGIVRLDNGSDPSAGVNRVFFDDIQEVYMNEAFLNLGEMTAPSAPDSNKARVFARDNGSGKTQLCVRFATGAVQVLATEP